MADDDEELFNSALTDGNTEDEPGRVAAQPEPEPEPEAIERPRDEHGRFLPKSEGDAPPAVQPQPEADPQPAPQRQEAPEHRDAIPPWRLKEEADARRAEAEARRLAEQERDELRQRMAMLEKQNQQPQKIPDIYEDPNAFVDHGVRTAVDPVKQEIAQLREFYSQRDAIREHGAEKVKSAYAALDQALRARDPEAVGVYQRARQSLDPFGDIVRWHQKQTVFSQIGPDPNAWLEQQLEERLKDPAYQAKLLERVRGHVQQQPNRPVTQLPPSLNKATASSPSDGDGDDDSEAGLLKSALRR
jgi:hypothetical protein